MKVLVTGAAGFVGSHVAERLHARGDEVVAVDSFSAYYNVQFKRKTQRFLLQKGIPVLELNLADSDLDADNLAAKTEGVEAIIHLAAQPGNSARTPFDHYVTNNIMATKRLLDWAVQRSDLKIFTNIATSSVYGKFANRAEDAIPEPISPYGVTKLAAEQLVLARTRDAGFPACSVRLYSVYGPRERPDKLFPLLIKSITDGKEFPLFEGSEKHHRSFTFVDDIVAGILATIDQPEHARGEIFNLGCDTSIVVGDAITLAEEILGTKAAIRHLPRRPGDQEQTSAEINKIRSKLGYEPKVQPAEGVRQMIEWYQREITDSSIYSMQ